MKKALFILPYYGSLPPYFSTWLSSCEYNSNFDWLIVSDSTNRYIEDKMPENCRFLELELSELKKKVESIIGFKFIHFNPYRLCDCRPLFGIIFNEEIKSYDSWGWCDGDLIFGDLNSFITKERLSYFDRIYSKGHLTIIKNSKEVNDKIEKILSRKEVLSVYKSKYPKGFDEGLFNKLCRVEKMNFFERKEFVDISPRYFNFVNVNSGKKIKLRYESGKVIDSNNVEYVYAHFQKRKFKYNLAHGKNFNITEIGFVDYELKYSRLESIYKDFIAYMKFINKYLLPQYFNQIKSKILGR